MIFTITGQDTLTLFDRVFIDLADGDSSTITFPNNIVEAKTGKNQNTLYAKNETGNNAELVLRLNRGSDDDKFLQQRLNTLNVDFAAFELANGEFIKRVGDGQGNVGRDIYTLRGGIFTKFNDTKENVEGDTEQSVIIYNMIFATAIRSIA